MPELELSLNDYEGFNLYPGETVSYSGTLIASDYELGSFIDFFGSLYLPASEQGNIEVGGSIERIFIPIRSDSAYGILPTYIEADPWIYDFDFTVFFETLFMNEQYGEVISIDLWVLAGFNFPQPASDQQWFQGEFTQKDVISPSYPEVLNFSSFSNDQLEYFLNYIESLPNIAVKEISSANSSSTIKLVYLYQKPDDSYIYNNLTDWPDDIHPREHQLLLQNDFENLETLVSETDTKFETFLRSPELTSWKFAIGYEAYTIERPYEARVKLIGNIALSDEVFRKAMVS